MHLNESHIKLQYIDFAEFNRCEWAMNLLIWKRLIVRVLLTLVSRLGLPLMYLKTDNLICDT